MRIDEARALAQSHRQRMAALVREVQGREADVAQLAGQLRVLAGQDPSAATARRRSDLRTRKHAAEAGLAALKEQIDTVRREIARIEQAVAAAGQARPAGPLTVARVATPQSNQHSAVVRQDSRPVATQLAPAARSVGSGSSALWTAVGTRVAAAPSPAVLPPPARGTWRTAILPAQDGSYGAKIGPFRIERLLGAGSQAAVFLATDAIRQVALKLIDAADVDESVWKALRREARRLAAIRSEHVLAAHGFDEIEYQPDPALAPYRLAYLALEYMDQGTLLHVEQQAGGRLDTADAVDAVVQAATGIAAIHSAGVLHRDIKPQNIMATARDGVQIYRVGDLGVAVEHELDAADFSGTLAYLAPEIVHASRDHTSPPFSHASDIYGLGATLYRLITGVTPVQALATATGSSGRVQVADLFARRTALPDPREARPDCPKPLAEAVLQATAFDPGARPASAEDLAEALEAAQHESSSTRRRFFPW
jgi:hypothetical protein